MHAVMAAAHKALPDRKYLNALGLQPKDGLKQPACSIDLMTSSCSFAVKPACTIDGSSKVMPSHMLSIACSLAQERHAAWVRAHSHCEVVSNSTE